MRGQDDLVLVTVHHLHIGPWHKQQTDSKCVDALLWPSAIPSTPVAGFTQLWVGWGHHGIMGRSFIHAVVPNSIWAT